MKTFLAIMIIGIFFFAGCSEKDSIVAPENNQTSAPNLITLPKSEGLSIEKEFSITKQINGKDGGELIIDESYKAGPRSTVKIITKLKFYPNSFKGIKDITLTVDDVNGGITFSPSMIFDIPAELYVKLEGLDLSGIYPNDIDFIYCDPSGIYGPVEHKEIIVDISSGTLELKEGKISHFSRYLFSR